MAAISGHRTTPQSAGLGGAALYRKPSQLCLLASSSLEVVLFHESPAHLAATTPVEIVEFSRRPTSSTTATVPPRSRRCQPTIPLICLGAAFRTFMSEGGWC